jgi:hypothetical protein
MIIKKRNLLRSIVISIGVVSVIGVCMYVWYPKGGMKKIELFAAPQGSGSACTIQSPCSLTEARDKVRLMDKNQEGDIHVNLRAGTYELDSPFVLGYEDSGSSSSRIVYQPYRNESVTISGGRQVAGWQLYDKSKNIYVANIEADFQSRQLFVNGRRAVRARSDVHPSGFTKTANGYLNASPVYANMGTWSRIKDIEVVGMTNWRNYRCGVQGIRNKEITIDPLCWSKTQHSEMMEEPVWFENALELLDNEGEWYGDWQGKKIYYKPRNGESIGDSEVIAPILEALVVGSGDPEHVIHHITLKGLTFAYGTWNTPSSDVGYVPMQAGFVYTDPQNRDVVASTPAQLQFQWASDIVIERNQFIHMGSTAVSFDRGSQNSHIVGNKFADISSHAIQIGNVSDSQVTGAALVKNNYINNNYISTIGQEYFDTVGIFVGYASGTLIDHNEIANVPYTGISVGWGWTDKAFESLKNNHITNNLIHDYMLTLNDGGAIYTLSRQDHSEISGNYVYNNNRDYGSIYLDLGSKGFTVKSNVISDHVTNWIFVQDTVAPYSTNNTISDNFTDSTRIRVYANNFVSNNIISPRGSWPDAAMTIMRSAGLEKAFQAIKM